MSKASARSSRSNRCTRCNELSYIDAHLGSVTSVCSLCRMFITCFQGSALTLVVPVNGWSRIYIKTKINVRVTVSAAVMRYCDLMFFIPKKYVYETVISPPISKTNQTANGTVSFPANILSRRYSARLFNRFNDSQHNSLLGTDFSSI